MSKTVRAFCNDEVSRRLAKRQKLEGDVLCINALDVEAGITFNRAFIEFEERTSRPYIMFLGGRITFVRGELPFGVTQCNFTRKYAPEIELKWELSNEEIKQLIDKGIYGFDTSYQKCRTVFEIPQIFREMLWENIPVKIDVLAVEEELEDSVKVPIISVSVDNPFYQVTNSFVTGYDNIATYFRQPEFHAEDYVEDPNEYFELLDDEIIMPEDMRRQREKKEEVRTPEVLSPSEQAEQEIRGELRQQIRENIAAITSQDQVEDIAHIDENLDVGIGNLGEDGSVSEYEPYTAAELEDMHIIKRSDEDHMAADAKIAEILKK